jgi:hypothetical protein
MSKWGNLLCGGGLTGAQDNVKIWQPTLPRCPRTAGSNEFHIGFLLIAFVVEDPLTCGHRNWRRFATKIGCWERTACNIDVDDVLVTFCRFPFSLTSWSETLVLDSTRRTNWTHSIGFLPPTLFRAYGRDNLFILVFWWWCPSADRAVVNLDMCFRYVVPTYFSILSPGWLGKRQ